MDILNKIEKAVKKEQFLAKWFNLGGETYNQGYVHGIEKCLAYLEEAKKFEGENKSVKHLEQEQVEYIQELLKKDEEYSSNNIVGSGEYQDGFLGGVARAQHLVRQEVGDGYFSEAKYYREALVNVSEYLETSNANKAVQVHKIHTYVNDILED